MNTDLVNAHSNLPSLMAMVAILGFSFYRRVRRNIGEQPIRPRRMIFRIALFGLIAGILMFAHAAQLTGQLSELGGIAAGAGLGALGVHLTRFHRTAKGDFYTPNPWLGTAVSLLFIGRIGYRFLSLSAMPGGMNGAAMMNPAAFYGNPKGFATLALFGVVSGYYMAYSAGVLWMHRRQRWPDGPAAPDAPPPKAMDRIGGAL